MGRKSNISKTQSFLANEYIKAIRKENHDLCIWCKNPVAYINGKFYRACKECMDKVK